MKPSIFRFKPLLLSLLLCAGAAMASEPVDINSADAAQLDKVLIGVGAAKAEAIIEYRKANGPFKSADELANVKGIGLKTVERNRDLIKVGGARAQAAPASVCFRPPPTITCLASALIPTRTICIPARF